MPPVKRVRDASCPRVYDQWEADGVSYVIQDLPPEDEDEALKLFVEDFVPDEVVCVTSGLLQDPLSMKSICESWRKCFQDRLTLACYATRSGERTLVALNCCTIKNQDDKAEFVMEGDAWLNMVETFKFVDDKFDSFKYFGVDTLLYAVGLVVKKEYRGAKIGCRLLEAREPLARSLDIKGTQTLFTGPASQRCAEKVGFTTVCEVTFTDLEDAGLKYPRDQRVMKVMVKKYD